MQWRPLGTELKRLLVPFALAIAIGLYGYSAPNPPFLIAGTWAVVVTWAVAVIRSLPQKGNDERGRE
ncbi:MAG: hypothetical protein HYU37_06455 [Acidobacteria bacterium]|nr:hypothetical protein [Acidobacteriota bacterium]